MARATTNGINKAIAKHDVALVKGDSYFYVVGTTDEMSRKLNELDHTSIYTPFLSAMSAERWISDVEAIVAQANEVEA